MSFLESNLLRDEKLEYQARLHWMVFLGPAIWLFVGWLCTSAGATALGTPVIIIGLLLGIGAAINYSTSEFGITNKRLLIKTGFIRRQSFEVLLPKVEGIQVSQGVLGRMFDFGTVVIRGTGGSQAPFHHISAPLRFRNQAQEQIERSQGTAAA
jgi:uncharacterized membrane protein YdbT with pleckstrin-like domain